MNDKFIITLLIGLALSGAPAHAQSYQIAPNPNPSGSTISITGLGAENLSNFENDGVLVIEGSLINSGILNSNAGGSLTISGSGVLDNYGELNNAGNFQFSVDSHTGTLNNHGTFTNSSADYGNYFGILNNFSTFNNSGVLYTMSAYNTGDAANNTGATLGTVNLHNSGTLNNSGTVVTDAAGTITNTGTLNNAGILNNTPFGHLNNSGILNNSGTLYTGQSLNNSGTFNNTSSLHSAHQTDNSGSLNNFGILEIYYPEDILNNTGTLNNFGTVLNDGTITGTGTYIQTAGQTVNNGSLSQASIQFDGGGLSGTGTVTGNVTIGSGASVNPGNSPGTMTINGDFTSAGTLVFEIAGLCSGLYDFLNIHGNASFSGGNIQFDFINGFDAVAGNYWDFMSAETITGWDTLNFAFNGLGTELGWSFEHLDTGEERLWITSNPVTPVPEPGSYMMLMAGLSFFGCASRRKKT